MRVNANAVLRSWTLLAAFGGSYAPDACDTCVRMRGTTCIILASNVSACARNGEGLEPRLHNEHAHS